MKTKFTLKHIFVLFIAFSIVSCNQNGSVPSSFIVHISIDDFKENMEIKGKEVVFDEIIYNPFQVKLIDSLLIMNEIYNLDYIFYVYNLNSKKKIAEFLKIGNGPNELLSPELIDSFDSKFLWVFDHKRQTLFKYSFYDLLENKYLVPDEKIKLNDYSTDPIILSENEILSRKPFNLERNLNFFDYNGILKKEAGEYPSTLDKEEYQEQEIIQGYKSKTISNYKNRIIKAYYHTDIIDICDTAGIVIKRITGPDNFTPMVKEYKRGMVTQVAPLKDSKVAYDFLKYADTEFFVLYSGKLYKDDDGLHSQLFVFDWDGNPLRRYKLDIPIFDYTIDTENRKIYGLTSIPEMRIIEYNY